MVPCQPRQLMGWAGAVGAGTRVLGGLGVACCTLEGTWVWASLLERVISLKPEVGAQAHLRGQRCASVP